MNPQIDRIKKIRQYILDSLNDLSVEQFNKVPSGFNNNIIWNLGHLIAAQQGVCYTRAGLKLVVDEKYTIAYKPGTKPEQDIGNSEIQMIKDLLFSTLERFETDYQDNIFTNYLSWTTRYGVELLNIDDALQFLLYHEGLHSGYITALKRLVKK